MNIKKILRIMQKYNIKAEYIRKAIVKPKNKKIEDSSYKLKNTKK